MPTHPEDTRWMHAALGLARRGLGNVWPNPAVGCVLTKDGRVVGRGWTQPGGRPHAETVALAQAGEAAKDATAYVTLEPCAHHGKTPPCSEALVSAGIVRAVVAMTDPDARVSGKGLRHLTGAGIEVETGVLADAAASLNAGFLSRVNLGRPMVTLKLAQSLDGRIATARGESRWITGPQARRTGHALRASHDAVMIGAGTARADDPTLDVRDVGMNERAPVRVITDGSLSLDLTSRLAQTAGDGNPALWLCHRPGVDKGRADIWRDLGATLIKVPASEQRALDLPALLAELGTRGITRILCEGGGKLAAALLADNLVDRLLTFTAGLAIGGDGIPSLAAFGAKNLSEMPRFDLLSQRVIGSDILCEWSPSTAPP